MKRGFGALKKLAARVGVRELARRTGYAESTIRKALSTGAPSPKLAEKAVQAKARSDAARKAARARSAPKKALENFTKRLGISETARRLGTTKTSVEVALSTGRLPKALSERALAAKARSDRAKKAAATRAAKRTKLPDKLRDKARELGKALGLPVKTITRYIERGGAPKPVIDAAIQFATSGNAYPLEWKHGRRQKLERDELGRFENALKKFVQATRTGTSEEINMRYQLWRHQKNIVRSMLTPEAWRKLVEQMGEKLGLADVGSFSVERFIRS
jgi:hypothetical protein